MTELPATFGELALQGAAIRYIPDYLDKAEAQELFRQLYEQVSWRHDRIKVFGKEYPQPRLTCFFSRNELSYTYSGIRMEPEGFPRAVDGLFRRINREFGTNLNCCLANLYRNGKDSNGWHSDDESALESQPVIASISLGSARYFHLRPKSNPRETYKICLQPGSLLIMDPPTQANWQHQVPKAARSGPRINLTFRRISASV